MPSLKDIRRRIGSVKNTRQTTRAMKMVSAAKLRRAQDGIINARPYSRKIAMVVKRIAGTQRVESPLFGLDYENKKELLVIVTSDKGLCGGFNANVSKLALQYYNENKNKHQIDVIYVGRKGGEFLRRRGLPKEGEVVLNLAKEANYNYAAKFSQKLLNAYLNEGYSTVTMVYNEFKSAIAQKPTVEQILPIDMNNDAWSATENDFAKDFIFEPNLEVILEQLLERHINVQVYRCFLESLASEHGARMNSMENATKNAGDIIKRLTLTYNNARQAAITKELIEIVSGAQALES